MSMIPVEEVSKNKELKSVSSRWKHNSVSSIDSQSPLMVRNNHDIGGSTLKLD